MNHIWPAADAAAGSLNMLVHKPGVHRSSPGSMGTEIAPEIPRREHKVIEDTSGQRYIVEHTIETID